MNAAAGRKNLRDGTNIITNSESFGGTADSLNNDLGRPGKFRLQPPEGVERPQGQII